MKELGDYLKETRESNCVSIEEAAEDLNISESIISNIESGNTRAFRDMFELKDRVKEYAKYLGLDPEKVVDEFNDFLFEHTSKISLKDILEAEEDHKQKEQNKISSPYTIQNNSVYIDKRYFKVVGACAILLLILMLIIIILKSILIPNENITNRELLSVHEIRGD